MEKEITCHKHKHNIFISIKVEFHKQKHFMFMILPQTTLAVLVGIVSRGKSCSFQNYPGIYTRCKVEAWTYVKICWFRVKSFLPWIRKHATAPQNYLIKETKVVQCTKDAVGHTEKNTDKYKKSFLGTEEFRKMGKSKTIVNGL